MSEKKENSNNQKKLFKLKAKLPKGFEDKTGKVLKSELELIETARSIYEQYGFLPLQTPAFEYADLIGKFLPDDDRPNKGVFAIEDDDQKWLALRYDLTAPLARYVAENFDAISKPYRRYQIANVWRNEKPGIGRFREFTQCDADSVGVSNITADSEMVMIAADIMKAVGNKIGDYSIKINDRRLLDALFYSLPSTGNEQEEHIRRMKVVRAIDKLDRLGHQGVIDLLGEGRKDESGDYTEGAKLPAKEVEKIITFIQNNHQDRSHFLNQLEKRIDSSEKSLNAFSDLKKMDSLLSQCGYESDQIQFDLSIVRGLDYYTSIVFEANILIETQNEKGQAVRIGSVGGGGRYDDLISRFRKTPVPATGFSFGVSRFATVLRLLERQKKIENHAIIILVMDHSYISEYFKIAKQARQEGLIAEVYLGNSGMKAQMKYADKKEARFAVIIGEDEIQNNSVTIKDLKQGYQLSKEIETHEVWKKTRPAQQTVPKENWINQIKNWDYSNP